MHEASQTVFLDGPTHYLDFTGADADRDAAAFVLVHGLGGSHQNWLSVGPSLGASRRTYALDLIGFGLTPPAGRSAHVRSQRRLLDRFTREVVGDRAVLVGNSMGGLVTMLQAATAPDAVAAMVLIDPALPTSSMRLDLTVMSNFAAFAVPGLGEAVLRRRSERLTPREQVMQTMSLVTVDAGRVDPAVLDAAERLARFRAGTDWAAPAFLTAARSLLRLLAQRGAHQRLVQSVTAPTLVIQGARDRLVSVDAARRLVQTRPDWPLHVLDDVGHVPQLEAPERTLALIVEWLDGQEAGRGEATAPTPA